MERKWSKKHQAGGSCDRLRDSLYRPVAAETLARKESGQGLLFYQGLHRASMSKENHDAGRSRSTQKPPRFRHHMESIWDSKHDIWATRHRHLSNHTDQPSQRSLGPAAFPGPTPNRVTLLLLLKQLSYSPTSCQSPFSHLPSLP